LAKKYEAARHKTPHNRGPLCDFNNPDMEKLKKQFIELASAVLKDNEELASCSITFKKMLDKKIVSSHKKKLREHFKALSGIDEQYVEYLNPNGSINDLQMKNAKLQILTLSRNMLVNAIKNYESSLTEFEGQVNFRLNITIAVIAIVISIVGVIT
jgi:hypothetical protein